MQIIIHTREGTFLVSPEKEADLISWLQRNAVQAGPQNVSERVGTNYPGQQLLSEQKQG